MPAHKRRSAPLALFRVTRHFQGGREGAVSAAGSPWLWGRLSDRLWGSLRALARAGTRGLMLLLCVSLASCDYVRPFEAVCERRLGPTEVSVEVVPVRFETDFSQPSSSLTARGNHAVGRIVLGLTETQLKGSIAIGGKGVAKPFGGRYCMRPQVHVKLAFDPMVLHVASEQKEGTCAHAITLNHERRHMGVYARYLDELAAKVESDLKQQFGDRILYFPNTGAAEAQVQADTATILKPYIENGMREVQEQQKRVDSPEEYSRMAAEESRCGS